MTNSILTLDRVSFHLPDGRILFSDLSEAFDARRTGLVGRNGVGKSVLARLLAGELAPSSGSCTRSGSIALLSQDVGDGRAPSVAALAGIAHITDALARIEAGSTDPRDFDAVGEHWDIAQRLRVALARDGLGHVGLDTPVAALSGGAAMRVALAGATLFDPDMLILDEPSNHLDIDHRRALVRQLQAWPKGLLVVSHDRELLGSMERIVELSPHGLRSVGGDFALYEQVRDEERQAAQQALDHARTALKRDEAARRDERERQQRRQARGDRVGKDANQAAILLGRGKERSEGSAGRLRRQHDAALAGQLERVRGAVRRVEAQDAPRIHPGAIEASGQRRVAQLDGVVLPWLAGPLAHIDLVLGGCQRLAIVGPNGCGKSTLLKVLAGRLAPRDGSCSVTPHLAWLDQQLGNLDPARTVLDRLLEANRTTGQGMLRTWLAQLGLDAATIARPTSLLSGGERLKAALACALYADPPPALLVLDEPTNHLDLPSLTALEAMLNGYGGALVVVSHDAIFLERVGLTHRLLASEEGWRLETS